MTKGDRLAAILITLQSRELVRAQELAERFEVSVRTIYRDMQALSEAGVPVMAIPGTGGGYRLMDGYRLPAPPAHLHHRGGPRPAPGPDRSGPDGTGALCRGGPAGYGPDLGRLARACAGGRALHGAVDGCPGLGSHAAQGTDVAGDVARRPLDPTAGPAALPEAPGRGGRVAAGGSLRDRVRFWALVRAGVVPPPAGAPDLPPGPHRGGRAAERILRAAQGVCHGGVGRGVLLPARRGPGLRDGPLSRRADGGEGGQRPPLPGPARPAGKRVGGHHHLPELRHRLGGRTAPEVRWRRGGGAPARAAGDGGHLSPEGAPSLRGPGPGDRDGRNPHPMIPHARRGPEFPAGWLR